MNTIISIPKIPLRKILAGESLALFLFELNNDELLTNNKIIVKNNMVNKILR